MSTEQPGAGAYGQELARAWTRVQLAEWGVPWPPPTGREGRADRALGGCTPGRRTAC